MRRSRSGRRASGRCASRDSSAESHVFISLSLLLFYGMVILMYHARCLMGRDDVAAKYAILAVVVVVLTEDRGFP